VEWCGWHGMQEVKGSNPLSSTSHNASPSSALGTPRGRYGVPEICQTLSLSGDAHACREGQHGAMIIALLALLGVDLIVILVLVGLMLSRRRWVSHQPGAFKGAIRVVDGEVSGLGPKWKRGYGRWVREVLVWSKKPMLFRNELVAVEGLAGEARAAEPGEVKRVGSDPVIVPLAADGGARVEVAATGDVRGRALGPLAVSAPPPSR
jgi:Protein of unknown function (DUF2550)